MTLSVLLNALIDAAVAKWPSWAGVFEWIRSHLTANLPADGGGLIVVGSAPGSITKIVMDFLNGVVAKTSGPILKFFLTQFVKTVPGILDSLWDSLFPNTPKPVMAAAAPDFDAVVKAADH